MIHEMMLPYVDQLMDDYHIIAPDLTGHGSDKGRFESAQKEAAEITDRTWELLCNERDSIMTLWWYVRNRKLVEDVDSKEYLAGLFNAIYNE